MFKSPFCIFLCLSLIVVYSCNELQVIDTTITPGYFNLPVFIQEQSDSLKNLEVTVSKTTRINDKTEEVFFRADTGFWKRELDIISSVDISQQAIRDRYKSRESDSSGFTMISYEAADPEMNGISYLRITRNGPGKIMEIVIRQKEKNLLYHNRRNIHLEFQDSTGNFPGLLREYSISGAQKITLRKEVAYEIRTVLDFKE